MRKTILAALSAIVLFAVSCKKNATEHLETTSEKSELMSSSFTSAPDDIHNIIGHDYYKKYGWNAPNLYFIIVENVHTWDSVLGASNNADSIATVMIAKASEWGLMGNNGFLKPISATMPIMLSMEPNAEYRAALTDVAYYRGPNGASYATTRLNAVKLTDPIDIQRREGYLNIYTHSLEMNYPINDLLGWTAEGYAAADAEGFQIWSSYTGPTPINDRFRNWAQWGACTWSNNYSCNNM